jgi:hypothetical protein
MATAPDVPKALATVNEATTSIDPSRAILYALAVGAKRSEVGALIHFN